jgi:hypothetical protein
MPQGPAPLEDAKVPAPPEEADLEAGVVEPGTEVADGVLMEVLEVALADRGAGATQGCQGASAAGVGCGVGTAGGGIGCVLSWH